MSVRNSKKKSYNLYVTIFFVALIFYFSYHAINGKRGIIAFFQLTQAITAKQNKLDSLKLERVTIERKVSLMRSESLDPDLLDEQARKILGYAGPNEKVYILNQNNITK